MPKYRFLCVSCSQEIERYTSVKTEEVPCPVCSQTMKRQLPRIAGQQVSETIDPLTNVSWKQDQQQLLKQRNEDHYWNVEVPRLVQTYSVETCLEQGWLVYNDKGELVINRPPSKR